MTQSQIISAIFIILLAGYAVFDDDEPTCSKVLGFMAAGIAFIPLEFFINGLFCIRHTQHTAEDTLLLRVSCVSVSLLVVSYALFVASIINLIRILIREVSE